MHMGAIADTGSVWGYRWAGRGLLRVQVRVYVSPWFTHPVFPPFEPFDTGKTECDFPIRIPTL